VSLIKASETDRGIFLGWLPVFKGLIVAGGERDRRTTSVTTNPLAFPEVPCKKIMRLLLLVLRWIFRKWEGVVGIGWSWLRIGTGGWHL